MTTTHSDKTTSHRERVILRKYDKVLGDANFILVASTVGYGPRVY